MCCLLLSLRTTALLLLPTHFLAAPRLLTSRSAFSALAMSNRPNFHGGRRGGGPNSRGGGRRGEGGGGGRGGGGRGGGGRGGEQRWWDPVWRAERLRQQAAEVTLIDNNTILFDLVNII